MVKWCWNLPNSKLVSLLVWGETYSQTTKLKETTKPLRKHVRPGFRTRQWNSLFRLQQKNHRYDVFDLTELENGDEEDEDKVDKEEAEDPIDAGDEYYTNKAASEEGKEGT